MLATLETGRILSKDDAARHVLPTLDEPHRSILAEAAEGYVGARRDDWTGREAEVLRTATVLAERVRA